MPRVIDINVGEMAVGVKESSIRTGGIGSCIVVCVYDEQTKAGGMIHAMLPTRSERGVSRPELKTTADDKAVAKYVDEGIERLVDEVEMAGGKRSRMVAKLVGGSKMFKFMRDDKSSIGSRNIEMAQKKLADLEIPIDGEDTGGTIGRMAEFNLENGLLDISVKL